MGMIASCKARRSSFAQRVITASETDHERNVQHLVYQKKELRRQGQGDVSLLFQILEHSGVMFGRNHIAPP
ncbi:hypothetical protein C0V97_04680 [Asaia sp. W19]|nr:hypothetical protein C0V97_04680 [Asaia sp. W19]